MVDQNPDWVPDGATYMVVTPEMEKYAADRERDAVRRLLSALDRCEHGRHAKDSCWHCPDEQSTGNLFLQEGQQIGTTLHGYYIIVPAMRDRGDIDRWIWEECRECRNGAITGYPENACPECLNGRVTPAFTGSFWR